MNHSTLIVSFTYPRQHSLLALWGRWCHPCECHLGTRLPCSLQPDDQRLPLRKKKKHILQSMLRSSICTAVIVPRYSPKVVDVQKPKQNVLVQCFRMTFDGCGYFSTQVSKKSIDSHLNCLMLGHDSFSTIIFLALLVRTLTDVMHSFKSCPDLTRFQPQPTTKL